jgi:DNA-binding NarL/FixJ family response regulator
VWAANRTGGDFTDRELELVTALQPLLVLLERTVGEVAPAGEPARAGAERVRLTARELEVLRLVAAGLTAGAAGRLLRVSERTVHKHQQNGYAELGAHDRLTAIGRARALGLLD